MPRDPLLIRVSFVTYMARKEHISPQGKLVHFWEKIEKQIREVAAKFDLQVECYQRSVYSIGQGKAPDNSGRCVVCNEWVSAQNRPNIIGGLGVGAEYRGSVYCADHLPRKSRMYSRLRDGC